MTFRDLLKLEFDSASSRIDKGTLIELLPDTPEDVIEQFYSDHGRNEDFGIQYSSIDISEIRWSKRLVEAKELINCSFYEAFNSVDVCSKWGQDVATEGWEYLLGTYPSWVLESWRTSNTWFRLPIFINGSLIQNRFQFHLVEGHSRLGFLKGLVQGGTVERESSHEIWYGDYLG